MEKKVNYSSINTYRTLNTISNTTRYVWLVFHGLGYLSEYFIKHFKNLNPSENYIICPQAPSKYYADTTFNKVGACWLTKENTALETENILNYIDAVMEKELSNNNAKLIVLGYSQGVSIAARWLVKRKKDCERFIMISGRFPSEIGKKDIIHFKSSKVYLTIGTNDPLISKELASRQIEKLKKLFPELNEIHHQGGHKMDTSLLELYL